MPAMLSKIGRLKTLLKGGPGSGNFGHAGRPGQQGGSGPGGSQSAQPPLIEAQSSRADIERAKDQKYLRKLQRNHGVRVDASPNADPVDVLSVHETLVSMPWGLKRYLKESGVHIKVVSNQDEKAPQFKVGSQTFTEGGHANYRDGSITIRTHQGGRYLTTSTIMAHEVGHFGVQALMGIAAEENAHENLIEKRIGRLREEAIGSLPSEHPRINGEINQLRAEQRKIATEGVGRLAKDFDEASRAEGGVTPYADSYVRDKAKGWSTDVWASEGTDKEGYSVNGRSAITRAGNENFAEIMGKLYQNARSGRRLQLSVLKDEKRKTYLAFKKLHTMLRNPKMKVTRAEAI